MYILKKFHILDQTFGIEFKLKLFSFETVWTFRDLVQLENLKQLQTRRERIDSRIQRLKVFIKLKYLFPNVSKWYHLRFYTQRIYMYILQVNNQRKLRDKTIKMSTKQYKLVESSVPKTNKSIVTEDNNYGGKRVKYTVTNLDVTTLSGNNSIEETYLNPLKTVWAKNKKESDSRKKGEWGNTSSAFTTVWLKITHNPSYKDFKKEFKSIRTDKVTNTKLIANLNKLAKEFTLEDTEPTTHITFINKLWFKVGTFLKNTFLNK